jgi:cytochrome c-type biogenesis protein CcmH
VVEHGRRIIAVLLCVAAVSSFAQGAIEAFDFDSPEQEARYHQLIQEIRCPKCINTNLAGSDAPIAADLRATVLRLLHEGASDQEVRDYLQARYGDFVLYDPPVRAGTALLWLAPVLLMAAGFGIIVVIVWRRRSSSVSALSDAERSRLAELLDIDRTKDAT